jgi:predicted component of viral defense system (DUF524 family)
MDAKSLHRARFDLGAGVVLDIESALGRGAPVPISWTAPGLINAEIELDEAQVSSGGITPMRWVETGELFERFQLREDADYFIDLTVPIPLKEAVALSNENGSWPFPTRLDAIFKRDPSRRWKEQLIQGKQYTTITGQLRLRSHAGIISFSTQFGSAISAEVVCRKLKYFEEFKALLDDLAEKMAELLLAFESPVSLSFGLSQDLAISDAALHFQMRRIMSGRNLPVVAEEILANPHVRLIEWIDNIPIEEIQEAEADIITDSMDISSLSKGGPLSRLFCGFTPKELPHRQLLETVDTPENRYAKAFLEQCRGIASRLERSMAARKHRGAEREAHAWGNTLDEALQRGMWREVGPFTQFPSNSQVLLRKRGYRELLKLDLSLRMSLSLPWQEGAELADGLIGDVRPVSKIYEYWSFLALYEILQSLCVTVKGGNLIEVSADGLRVRLTKGRQSECRFRFNSATGTGIDISLFYNKRFRRPKTARPDWSGSYTASFDPDFSIVVVEKRRAHWLHFDAKYRLERREMEQLFDTAGRAETVYQNSGDESASYYEEELARVYRQEDLFKMHTYRDGILGTRGAYILFPGDGIGGRIDEPTPTLFVRHPRAIGSSEPHRIPSVGAFDLTPNGNPGQVAAIRALFGSVFESVAADNSYIEEDAFFKSSVPPT